MQARPTTDQILNDLAREVREALIPSADPALKVNLEMMEQLLIAAAVRAGHEIAWMADEVDSMVLFAEDVETTLNDQATSAALSAFRAGRNDSLHLSDQVENYSLAGEAFGCALDAAGGHDRLAEEGATLIRGRRDTEAEIRPGFYFPGRS
jgi:hypothetical protein